MTQPESYRKAENKIEEALLSGATELDLSMDYDQRSTEGLIELPESLGQLTELQSLDLAYNRLTALPEWITRLTHLQFIDLRNNHIAELPEWIAQLTQLRSLNLSSNELPRANAGAVLSHQTARRRFSR